MGVGESVARRRKVLYPGAIHIHIQRDIVADAVQPPVVAGFQHAHNLPACRKVRSGQSCIHRFKPGIAIGSIDARMKRGIERHGMAGIGELEVGGIGLPVDDEIAQRSLVAAGGIQHAGNAGENRKIGVIKCVVAVDGLLPGSSTIHGPKLPVVWMAPGGLGLSSCASKTMGAPERTPLSRN